MNISPLVNIADLVSFKAVAGSLKLLVILSMICRIMKTGGSGYRQTKGQSAASGS